MLGEATRCCVGLVTGQLGRAGFRFLEIPFLYVSGLGGLRETFTWESGSRREAAAILELTHIGADLLAHPLLWAAAGPAGPLPVTKFLKAQWLHLSVSDIMEIRQPRDSMGSLSKWDLNRKRGQV